MIVLTDDPTYGAALLDGDVTVWRSAAPALDPALARELGLPAEPFAFEAPGGFWHTVVLVSRVPVSQFDVLRDWCAADRGLPGPVACHAGAGTGFHGHRGRAWKAAPGNLHLSVALAPTGLPAADGVALTMLPAVAVADAIRVLSSDALAPGIKWVNDLLLGGAKTAGVLTATQTMGEEMSGAVLGAGVNVEAAPDVPPTPFVPAVTCVADHLPGVTLAAALRAVLDTFAKRLAGMRRDGPAEVLRAYRESSTVVGREVVIRKEGEESAPPLAAGRVIALNDDLSLTLEGHPESVSRGRLAFAEDDPNGRS